MASQIHGSSDAAATPSDHGSDGGHWAGQHQRAGDSSSAGVQEQLGSMAEAAKAQAAEAVQPMKEAARKVAQDQKNIVADRMGQFARSIDAAAGQFGRESPTMGEVLSAAAGSIRNASESLRQRHIDDLSGALQEFGRKRPAALFAGAVAAGFAISRFVKSSAPEPSGRSK
jgi:hypothetical protein